MKNATIIAMTFATLVTATLMSGTASAGITTCKEYVTASGESAGAVAKFRMRRAKRRAISAWEKEVSHEFGNRYADYDDAKYPSMQCSLNARGNTKCTVTAYACD